MARYSTGESTKNNIYETCRRLFYENGFDGTAYSQILRESGVNPGTFSYHFKNRENVARMICTEYIGRQHEWVDAHFPLMSEDERAVLAQCIFRRLMYDDEKLYRFFSETASHNLGADVLEEYKSTYVSGYSLFRSVMGDEQADIFFAASSGMATTLEPYLYERRNVLSFEKCAHYSINAYLMYLRPREDLSKSIDRALAIVDGILIENNGFDVTLTDVTGFGADGTPKA